MESKRLTRARYLDYELGSVLLVLPLLVEALHDACVGSLYVVGDELLNYIDDLLSHLLKLLFVEVGHYLGAAHPLHPPMEALVQGPKGELHYTYQFQSVLVRVIHDPPELFQSVFTFLCPILVHFGSLRIVRSGFT